jgi:hypothetical protein
MCGTLQLLFCVSRVIITPDAGRSAFAVRVPCATKLGARQFSTATVERAKSTVCSRTAVPATVHAIAASSITILSTTANRDATAILSMATTTTTTTTTTAT